MFCRATAAAAWAIAQAAWQELELHPHVRQAWPTSAAGRAGRPYGVIVVICWVTLFVTDTIAQIGVAGTMPRPPRGSSIVTVTVFTPIGSWAGNGKSVNVAKVGSKNGSPLFRRDTPRV